MTSTQEILDAIKVQSDFVASHELTLLTNDLSSLKQDDLYALVEQLLALIQEKERGRRPIILSPEPQLTNYLLGALALFITFEAMVYLIKGPSGSLNTNENTTDITPYIVLTMFLIMGWLLHMGRTMTTTFARIDSFGRHLLSNEPGCQALLHARLVIGKITEIVSNDPIIKSAFETMSKYINAEDNVNLDVLTFDVGGLRKEAKALLSYHAKLECKMISDAARFWKEAVSHELGEPPKRTSVFNRTALFFAGASLIARVGKITNAPATVIYTTGLSFEFFRRQYHKRRAAYETSFNQKYLEKIQESPLKNLIEPGKVDAMEYRVEKASKALLG